MEQLGIFLGGITCNSKVPFYFSTNNGAFWIKGTNEIYTEPSGLKPGSSCIGRDRFQSCARMQSLVGDCVRIDLQGSPSRSIARTIYGANCEDSKNIKPKGKYWKQRRFLILSW